MYNPRTNHQPTGVLNGLELWCILKNGFGWSMVKYSGARACRACGAAGIAWLRLSVSRLGMALVRLHHSPLHLLLDAGCGVRWEGLAKRKQCWICGIIWVCEKNIVETSRRRWKLMVGKDEPEIHANHGETARSSVDISWLTNFQALIVNVAGEDFCYTFHEMRERPVRINSNLQEDRGTIDQNRSKY